MGGLAIKLDMFNRWPLPSLPFGSVTGAVKISILKKVLPAGCCRRRHNYFP